MARDALKIGISACFSHADPNRPTFKGKVLQYIEESAAHWIMEEGALTYMIPSPGDHHRLVSLKPLSRQTPTRRQKRISMNIINPATGETITSVETSTPEEVTTKANAARKAQASWAATPLSERLAIMTRFTELLKENAEQIAADMSSEVGKPVGQARGEVGGTLGRLAFFLEEASKVLGDEVVLDESATGGMREYIGWEPLGVVANISAWNYPLFVGCNVFAPALLAGNAVLYKPSEYATLTGQHIARLLWKAGVPKDVFALLVGAGEIGKALLEQNVDGVFFTGSYATGQKISETVGGRFVHLQLELGGKDPVYVTDGVDVAKVAAGLADGAFYNTGQSCCAVERIYVHSDVYAEFVKHFEDAVKSFVMGDPSAEGTYIGPLTRAPQLDVLDAQVKDAVDKGATLLTGGKRVESAGNYFEPTVLVHVNHDMAVMKEESFGPIIGIMEVSDDAEATALMNDTDYGLTSGVFTTDFERAKPILRNIQSGTVYWNCCDRVSPRLPWSGRKQSGVGLTLSTHGIRAFARPKAWHLRQP